LDDISAGKYAREKTQAGAEAQALAETKTQADP